MRQILLPPPVERIQQGMVVRQQDTWYYKAGTAKQEHVYPHRITMLSALRGIPQNAFDRTNVMRSRRTSILQGGGEPR